MSKKSAIIVAILSLFIIIPYIYLEYKLTTKATSSTIQFSDNICLKLPSRCVRKVDKKGLTLFCRNGESAHLKRISNYSPSQMDKKLTSNFKDAYLIERVESSSDEKVVHILNIIESKSFIELTTHHKGDKSFLINGLTLCSKTIPPFLQLPNNG